MRDHRKQMTVRIVPLRSWEAGEAPAGGSIAERLAMLARLSEDLYTSTGRLLPTYRGSIPVRITALSTRSDRD